MDVIKGIQANIDQAGGWRAVRDSPCTSYWLKDAIDHNWGRDPVDALMDAEVLVALLRTRWDAISAGRWDDPALPMASE
jgi:hypothetical protein